MQSKAFENEFLKNLAMLTKEQQGNALAYIKSLLKRDSNKQALLQFAGTLDPASVREIDAAIEAGCENVDRNEW